MSKNEQESYRWPILDAPMPGEWNSPETGMENVGKRVKQVENFLGNSQKQKIVNQVKHNRASKSVDQYYKQITTFGETKDAGQESVLNSKAYYYSGVPATNLNDDVVSASQIDWEWDLTSTAADGVYFYKYDSSGSFLDKIALPAGTKSYSWTGLSQGTKYGASISVYWNDGTESERTPIRYSVSGDAITSVSGSAANSTQIDWSWTLNTSDEDGVYIYKYDGDGNLIDREDLAAGSTSYPWTGLYPDTQYCVRVTAYWSDGTESEKTTETCVTTDAPTAPSSLSCSLAGLSQLDYSWTLNTSSEDGVYFYKYDSVGSLIAKISLPPGTTSYSWKGLNTNTQYCARVSVYWDNGDESSKTTETCCTTDSLSAPSSLSATVIDPGKIDFSWTLNSTEEDGVYFYKYDGSGNLLSKLELPAGTTSHSLSGLKSGTQYCAKVSVYTNDGSESSKSSESCGTTDPASPPSDLTSSVSGYDVTFTWNLNSTPAGDGVYLYRYIDGSYMDTLTLSSGTESYTWDNALSTSSEACAEVSEFWNSGYETDKTKKVCQT